MKIASQIPLFHIDATLIDVSAQYRKYEYTLKYIIYEILPTNKKKLLKQNCHTLLGFEWRRLGDFANREIENPNRGGKHDYLTHENEIKILNLFGISKSDLYTNSM